MNIHATADVDDGAIVSGSAKVWHYVHVRSGAEVGDHAVVGRSAYIGSGVKVGKNCKIQNNAMVYEPALLEDGVFVGPGVIFTNDHRPRAVNPDGSFKAASDWEPVGVTCRFGAAIGAGAVCVAPVTIGRWAMVGAGSTVVSDVPDHALVVGSPAKQIGWISESGVRLEAIGDQWKCPDTGRTYTQSNDGGLKAND